ncbi:MAG: phenylalanine--tRNA ligase subunit alpha [Puniceicoccales bacterium]|jgi:phenylalanyl-tRNA synthetase alpha chain|nr:phenylalanine--tRNA ligase subunit alpha [Puniceicoccales bacterium]
MRGDDSEVVSIFRQISEAEEILKTLNSVPKILALKATYLGDKSLLNTALRGLRDRPVAERSSVGQHLNRAKTQLEALFTAHLERLDQSQTILGPPPDLSLPSPDRWNRGPHPLTQIQSKIVSIFSRWGYSVVKGPEVDDEEHCFDALNVPPGHPVREAHDTFYLTTPSLSPQLLLRPHTSNAQIHTLQKNPPPLRILSPGRVFRRDNVDATHHFNFHQIELLYVERRVTVADLKGTIEAFVKDFFGPEFKYRLRPSFFPFTEPSYEVDIRAPQGDLHQRWIEILGCGLVHPKVFEATGYPSQKWQGFAVGMGIERLAMLWYGVDDVRRFYTNDIRFLGQF